MTNDTIIRAANASTTMVQILFGISGAKLYNVLSNNLGRTFCGSISPPHMIIQSIKGRFIEQSTKDPKQLFNTLGKLNGQVKEKVFPKKHDEQTTAKEMAEFYVKKIEDIRENLSLNTNTLPILLDSTAAAGEFS